MKVDWKSLKVKNWLYLCLFALLILLVLGILQFALLGRFNENMKANEVQRIGQTLTAHYGQEDFNTLTQEYWQKYNITIALIPEYEFAQSGLELEILPNPFRGGMRAYLSTELLEIQKQFQENPKKDAIHFLFKDEGNKSSKAVFVSKLPQVENQLDNGTVYLYISAFIPPIDSAMAALRTQFLMMIVILLALSLIMAQLLSRKLSRPLERLTKTAERLAHGDMEVSFENSDFREIQQLSDTLNYATRELSKTERYRKEFIANLSHDLKTPLTIIKFYGELIHDVSGENPEKRNAHSEMIVKEADWLTGMVNEVLELSKLEADEQAIAMEQVNLSACLQETLESFQAVCEKEGYTIQTDIADNLYCSGSALYLRRALYNLISNAINYTGEDKTIFVTLRDLGGKLHFSVRDTGMGIPQEKMESIWERYYKASETHKRAVVGTGLGLSIVKKSLELHKAAFGVQSREGEGSVFWFEMATLRQ